MPETNPRFFKGFLEEVSTEFRRKTEFREEHSMELFVFKEFLTNRHGIPRKFPRITPHEIAHEILN